MLSASTTIAKGDNLTTLNNLLESIRFVDEIRIYVMDIKDDKQLSGIAEKFNATLVDTPRPPVVEHIRDQQINDTKNPWVLIVDFDETIPTNLQKEILAITNDPNSLSAYSIPRLNYSLRCRLTRGGWGTDHVVRLIRKSGFITWPHEIHSTPKIKGKIGKTNNYMEHHKDESLESMIDKTNRYSFVEAMQYYKGGLAEVTAFTLLRKTIMEIIRRGIIKGGILDGPIGLIQSIYQGYSVFISYAKLYEKQLTKDSSKPVA